MKNNRSLVITTIAPPNPVLRQCAEECSKHGLEFVIAGDRKSPGDFQLEGADYWSIERQKDSGFKSAGIIPENHYARKNVGYLAAISTGNDIIIETDDDNLPNEDFWQKPEVRIGGSKILDKGWINVYSLFSDEKVWPRGFPLEELSGKQINTSAAGNHHCPIQQGLADDNPDVDAVYRLTRELPLRFKTGLSFILGEGSWCPFNSQNTVWFREAFPLLYLPATCSFRMTDIWRSFIAQRISWAYGWSIAFYSPTVWQERNKHNLLKDFEDEVPGYLNNARIAKALETLPLSSEPEKIFDNLNECYNLLVEMNLVDREELKILKEWSRDMQKTL